MIPVDACAVIWVRADGYDLIPVDAGPDAYRTFRHAQRIAEWQTTTGKDTIGDAIQPVERVGMTDVDRGGIGVEELTDLTERVRPRTYSTLRVAVFRFPHEAHSALSHAEPRR